MIINETYNLEEDDIPSYMTLNEYNLFYITRIIMLCNKNNFREIAIGIDLFDLLSHYNLFNYYLTNKERKNKGIIELVGSINTKTDVYLDFRLKNNQIIMGNLIDIKHYINCTLRKEKIEKIEKNVSYKK